MAANVKVSILIFLAPKVWTVYRPNWKKVLTITIDRCKFGLFTNFGILIFARIVGKC